MDRAELDRLWSDEQHWNRDGSYKCAADPRVLVPKRYGGGWTLNMSHPQAWIVMASVVVLVLGFVVALILVVRSR